MRADSSTPIIFDRQLLRARLQRLQNQDIPDFLQLRTAEDLTDRLLIIKRPFERSLDLSLLMTDYSAAVCASGRSKPLTANLISGNVIADEEKLPFREGSFDLIVSGLSLQWINDLPGALQQIRHLLAPDGFFIACLIGGLSLIELRTVFAQAEEEITGGVSPRVSPFVEIKDLGHLLQRAGFALPVTDVDSFSIRYNSLVDLMLDLKKMSAGNILSRRSRKPIRRDVILRASEIYAERFSDQDGRIRASFEIMWLAGWAPHVSQQQPAKPGSCQFSLEKSINRLEK
jgi:SAM-dependent methyltransferase